MPITSEPLNLFEQTKFSHIAQDLGYNILKGRNLKPFCHGNFECATEHVFHIAIFLPFTVSNIFSGNKTHPLPIIPLESLVFLLPNKKKSTHFDHF